MSVHVSHPRRVAGLGTPEIDVALDMAHAAGVESSAPRGTRLSRPGAARRSTLRFLERLRDARGARATRSTSTATTTARAPTTIRRGPSGPGASRSVRHALRAEGRLRERSGVQRRLEGRSAVRRLDAGEKHAARRRPHHPRVRRAGVVDARLGARVSSATRGYRFTEDHLRIHDPQAKKSRPSVVLNYASRTPARLLSAASLWCRLARPARRLLPARIAIHPADMRFALLRSEVESPSSNGPEGRRCDGRATELFES